MFEAGSLAPWFISIAALLSVVAIYFFFVRKKSST
jgi:hypothetical protein